MNRMDTIDVLPIERSDSIPPSRVSFRYTCTSPGAMKLSVPRLDNQPDVRRKGSQGLLESRDVDRKIGRQLQQDGTELVTERRHPVHQHGH